MPGKEQQLEDAYGYFENWANEKNKFEALLADDVVWIETDADLDPGRYEGKAAVMSHVDHIKQALAMAEFRRVGPQGSFLRAVDRMQVQGHHEHDCITDVRFDGDLIAEVHHCLGHVAGGGGGGGH